MERQIHAVKRHEAKLEAALEDHQLAQNAVEEKAEYGCQAEPEGEYGCQAEFEAGGCIAVPFQAETELNYRPEGRCYGCNRIGPEAANRLASADKQALLAVSLKETGYSNVHRPEKHKVDLRGR